MDPRDYVHELGARLEASTDGAERSALIGMLAATGSADAGPYLAEALACEEDPDLCERIRTALAVLEPFDR